MREFILIFNQNGLDLHLLYYLLPQMWGEQNWFFIHFPDSLSDFFFSPSYSVQFVRTHKTRVRLIFENFMKIKIKNKTKKKQKSMSITHSGRANDIRKSLFLYRIQQKMSFHWHDLRSFISVVIFAAIKIECQWKWTWTLILLGEKRRKKRKVKTIMYTYVVAFASFREREEKTALSVTQLSYEQYRSDKQSRSA